MTKTLPAAGGWVKWEKSLETDPRFIRLVRLVRDRCVTTVTPASLQGPFAISLTVGCLLRLWSYADTHIRADNVLDFGHLDIDEYVGVAGFAKALPEDWLVILDDQHVELVNYQAHNGVVAKKRALEQKRQDNKRQRDRIGATRTERDGSVTTVTHLRDDSVTRPDQTRPDQESESARDAPATKDAPPARTIPMGSNLTQLPGAGTEGGLDAWKDVTGINAAAFTQWLVHIEVKGKMLGAPQRLHQAKYLAGQGSASEQKEVVDWSIGQDCKSLIPLRDVRARRDGMTRAPFGKPAGPTAGERDQANAAALQVLKDSRAGIGMPDFRDPWPHESADYYRTALRNEARQRGIDPDGPRQPNRAGRN